MEFVKELDEKMYMEKLGMKFTPKIGDHWDFSFKSTDVEPGDTDTTIFIKVTPAGRVFKFDLGGKKSCS